MSLAPHLVALPTAGVPERRIAWSLDGGERAALAADAGILAVDALTVTGEFAVWGEGARLTLKLEATAVQACTITLEPVEERIAETIVRTFLPAALMEGGEVHAIEIHAEEEDPPEPITSNQIDLSPIVLEHLVLALDPYPRAPGAVYHPPAEDASLKPFAALAKLKREP